MVEPVTHGAGESVLSGLLELEPVENDVLVGEAIATAWGGMYGGQLACQALLAAAATVGSGRYPHSAHASFLRRGNDREHVTYHVERVRDGRSFSARAVRALQGGRELAVVSAGFHALEDGADLTGVDAPAAPPPEALLGGGWSTVFDRRYAATEDARVLAWLRPHDEVGADPVRQACVLAFMADDLADDAALALVRPDARPGDGLASRAPGLDVHGIELSLWFHRPVSEDGWRLHELRCVSSAGGRATVLGEVFDAGGRHLATLGAQVLLRRAGSGQ